MTVNVKSHTVNIACPSEELADALTSYLDQEGHTVVQYNYRRGVMVTTDAPVAVVNIACQSVSWGNLS